MSQLIVKCPIYGTPLALTYNEVPRSGYLMMRIAHSNAGLATDEKIPTELLMEHLRAIVACDKTPVYRIGQPNVAGEVPPNGYFWLTPKETAEYLIAVLELKPIPIDSTVDRSPLEVELPPFANTGCFGSNSDSMLDATSPTTNDNRGKVSFTTINSTPKYSDHHDICTFINDVCTKCGGRCDD